MKTGILESTIPGSALQVSLDATCYRILLLSKLWRKVSHRKLKYAVSEFQSTIATTNKTRFYFYKSKSCKVSLAKLVTARLRPIISLLPARNPGREGGRNKLLIIQDKTRKEHDDANHVSFPRLECPLLYYKEPCIAIAVFTWIK
eukprot:scaffold3598_cov148-Skeletonema_dohrnii-CCMP3373.AAC.10